MDDNKEGEDSSKTDRRFFLAPDASQAVRSLRKKAGLFADDESMCMDEFDPIWDKLSKEGKCDAPEGMEHYRVRGEWFDANCPSDIESFIIARANITATEK